jgi:AcrR family transcriptional regulator
LRPRLRRIGKESSKTRADLLDAAETLMRTEGYAAVTSRNVAKKARLTPQLVHYYFETMDELFLALWRRFVSNNVERQRQAFESSEPLRALWQFSRESADTLLETEFLALAHHRKSICDEIARDGENFRQMQFELLSRKLADREAGEGGASPEILVVLLSTVARSLVMEKDLGMSAGHRATLEYIERWIDSLQR